MKAFLTGVCVFLLVLVSSPAQSQVLRCTEKMRSISDDLLQRAVDDLKSKHPGISFQTGDPACWHKKYTVNALTATLSRNYLKNVSGYELVAIVNGNGYFTVERFKSQNPKDLLPLEIALKNCHFCKLQIEANTRLEYFLTGDSIVFMISSVLGGEENSKLFHQMRQFFSPSIHL